MSNQIMVISVVLILLKVHLFRVGAGTEARVGRDRTGYGPGCGSICTLCGAGRGGAG